MYFQVSAEIDWSDFYTYKESKEMPGTTVSTQSIQIHTNSFNNTRNVSKDVNNAQQQWWSKQMFLLMQCSTELEWSDFYTFQENKEAPDTPVSTHDIMCPQSDMSYLQFMGNLFRRNTLKCR